MPLTSFLISKKLRVNQFIRAQTVRLIDDEGKLIEVVDLGKALEMARERELDLVEVAPNAVPPVCKFMDYGKYIYRQQKAERKHNAQQKQTEVKGIRIGFRTGIHDIEVKAKQTRKFLGDRNVVKVTMLFRGRENTHKDLGMEKMRVFYNMVKDVCKLDDRPKSQGNTLFMILSPVTNPGAAQGPQPRSSAPKTAPSTQNPTSSQPLSSSQSPSHES